MSKEELKKAIEVAEKELSYTENIHCDACLRERLKQRKLDEETYRRKLMENTIRRLRFQCKWCGSYNLIDENDVLVCTDCGAIQSTGVNEDGDYISHRIRCKR